MTTYATKDCTYRKRNGRLCTVEPREGDRCFDHKDKATHILCPRCKSRWTQDDGRKETICGHCYTLAYQRALTKKRREKERAAFEAGKAERERKRAAAAAPDVRPLEEFYDLIGC